MENEHKEYGTGEPRDSKAGSGPEPKGKRGVEDRLDDMADRFSRSVADGLKRLEAAFDRAVHKMEENPNLGSGRVRGFFTSSSGGAILIVIGLIWFFYTVGLLGKPIFPILMIILGIYIMQRYKSS